MISCAFYTYRLTHLISRNASFLWHCNYSRRQHVAAAIWPCTYLLCLLQLQLLHVSFHSGVPLGLCMN